MAGITIGSVSVAVVPSAEGFADKLRETLLPQADALGADIGERIRLGIESELKDINLKVKVDTGDSDVKVAALAGEMEGLKEAEKGAGDAASGVQNNLTHLSPVMVGLIGTLVALSPVIVTVGIGLVGVSAAAFKVLDPILKASQATGGLAANLHTLNPEQQTAAKGLLDLDRSFGQFTKDLTPTIFKDFNDGLRVAGTLLTGIEPVSLAVGKGLGGMLNAIDTEFQSGTWQNFFGFMATTARPDMLLLTQTFTSLLDTLPGLLISLQPVAVDLLQIANAGLKVVDFASNLPGWLDRTGTSAERTGTFLGGMKEGLVGVAKVLIQPGFGLDIFKHLAPDSARFNEVLDGVKPKLKGYADEAELTAIANEHLSNSITTVTADLGLQTTALLTNQGDWVQWKQDQQAAATAIDGVSGSLNSQSGAALAADKAIITSSQSAITFANAQKNTTDGVRKASNAIQDQIRFLETHAGKSKIAKQEIVDLEAAEARLKANLHQRIVVDGSGKWGVSGQGPGAGTPGITIPGGGGHHITAEGWLVTGGIPGVDSVPILAQQGELVVPTPIVNAGAVDHLRGLIPGFADGGVVGSFSGSPSGLGNWLVSKDKETVNAISGAVAAAISGALAAGGGGGVQPMPGGGSASANAALARRMMPAWASGAEWVAWNNVAMRESGWNANAANPTSDARGIAQNISGWGPGYEPGNAGQQIAWMINYIRGRYGDPIGAWNHETAFGWYDQGGWMPPGGFGYNGTNRPEAVFSPDQIDTFHDIASGGGGREYHAHFDGASSTALQSTVRTAFAAMEMQDGARERIGRRR